ncbi:ThiamineS, partial [mine drainage metagenome]
MRVTVLYFAHARSARGLAREDLDLPAGTTVGDLHRILIERLGPSVSTFHLARNEEYTDGSERLENGDEVAVIPPVSGGAELVGPRTVEVEDLIAAVRGPEHGAICIFLGTVRNEFAGRPTARLYYEAYDGMAASELAKIA